MATRGAQAGLQGISNMGADGTKRGCGTDVQEVARMSSTVLCSSLQLLYLLYFYTWTADHFCGEGDEMPAQTQ